MKFAIAPVSYWDSLGFSTVNWRKSANGTQAVCHLDYAEKLGLNLYSQPQVQIYDSIDKDFTDLLSGPDWMGTGVNGDPDTYSIMNELNKFETNINNSTAEQLADLKEHVNTRIDSLVTEPMSVSVTEVIDARDGKVSLGANLREIKSSVKDTADKYNLINERVEKTTYHFDTVEEMKAYKKLKVGDRCWALKSVFDKDIATSVYGVVGQKDVPTGVKQEDIVALDNRLVAYKVTEIKGGGGTGTGGTGGTTNIAVMTLTNNTGWLYKGSLEGEQIIARLNWSSTEEGMSTGLGILAISVNGLERALVGIDQGDVTHDITPYLVMGDNNIQLKVSDTYGNSRTLRLRVELFDLRIVSSFNPNTVYTGDINFQYTPYGESTKVVHFILDGEEVGTQTVESSGRDHSYRIPFQSHGDHLLRVYFTTEISGKILKSNELSYAVMFVNPVVKTTILASNFETKTATQYQTLNIPYQAYNQDMLQVPVLLKVDGEEVSNLTVGRGAQIWSYRLTKPGQHVFEIVSGAVTKQFNVVVTSLDITAKPVTESLKLHLSTSGRSNSEKNKDTWENSGIKANFDKFNWVSDGWQLDKDGISCLRLAGDARLNIPLNIFSGDPRVTGKTIEIEFATKNVMNYDATVISAYSGGIGLDIKAQEAILKSEQARIVTRYKEDEHIRLTFVIEKRAENRLLQCYVNGILSRVIQYPTSDNFAQPVPVGLSIGSNDCGIDLYNIRVYDNSLTHYQVVENWIADTQKVDQLLERQKRNDIFDNYGNIVISKLPPDLPYFVIVAPELPQYKGDKKVISGRFVDPSRPDRSFNFTGAQANVQGTSSQFYARKNFKISFKKGLVVDGVQTPTYAVEENDIPTDEFTFKADVASSESANNTQLVRIFNDTTPYKSAPQKADPRVRQGINGFPMVVFWDNGDKITFLGKYNFNNDKGTEEVFGFKDGDEAWEIANNTSDRVLFKTGDFTTGTWTNDFEGRFPEDTENLTLLQPFVSWVASMDRTKSTNSVLSEPVTLENVVHTHDTADYRLARFRSEAPAKLNMDSTLFFYIFTELFLMVDQRAKNVFPTKYAEDKWSFLPYDMDTALGINNEGELVFDYHLEDTDMVGNTKVFNAQDSVLWTNVRDAFPSEIKAMYQKLRSTGALSFDKISKAFTNHQSKWSEAIFNEDGYYKYIEPLKEDGSLAYLGMVQGSKAEQRKWWLYNRFRYMDSKFNAGDSINDVITLRGYAKTDITVEPYADIYATIKYGSYLVSQRALRGKKYTVKNPLDNVNDTEIYIYSASQLKSVGDLSGLKVGYAEFAFAERLQELKLGSAASGYTNTNLISLHMGNNRLLKTIDVRNCVNLEEAVDLTGCESIQEVYFQGTKVTGVLLPDGGQVTQLHLPETVKNLTVKNQNNIVTFSMPSYRNINTLRIENSPKVPLLNILNQATSLARARLINVDISTSDTSLLTKLSSLAGLDENDNIIPRTTGTTGAVVTGKWRITNGSINIVNRLKIRFPELEITVSNLVPDFKVTFKDYQGNEVDVQYVVGGGKVEDPILRLVEPIEAPKRDSDAEYDYTFRRWIHTFSNSINSSITILAEYTSSRKKYQVKFTIDGTVVQESQVEHGGTATYSGPVPSVSEGMILNGWDPPIDSPITSNINFKPDIAIPSLPNELKPFEDLKWSEIKALKTETKLVGNNLITNDPKYTTNWEGFSPMGEFPQGINGRVEKLVYNEYKKLLLYGSKDELVVSTIENNGVVTHLKTTNISTPGGGYLTSLSANSEFTKILVGVTNTALTQQKLTVYTLDELGNLTNPISSENYYKALTQSEITHDGKHVLTGSLTGYFLEVLSIPTSGILTTASRYNVTKNEEYSEVGFITKNPTNSDIIVSGRLTDGVAVVTLDTEGSVQLKNMIPLVQSSNTTKATFSPDGKTMSIGYSGSSYVSIYIYTLNDTGEYISNQTISTGRTEITNVIFSKDSRFMYIQTGNEMEASMRELLPFGSTGEYSYQPYRNVSLDFINSPRMNTTFLGDSYSFLTYNTETKSFLTASMSALTVWASIGNIKTIKRLDGVTSRFILASYNHYNTDPKEDSVSLNMVTLDALRPGRQMNTTEDNSGGWANTDLRAWLNNEHIKELPLGLQSIINTVEIDYNDYEGIVKVDKTCYDKLYVPKASELSAGEKDSKPPYRYMGADIGNSGSNPKMWYRNFYVQAYSYNAKPVFPVQFGAKTGSTQLSYTYASVNIVPVIYGLTI